MEAETHTSDAVVIGMACQLAPNVNEPSKLFDFCSQAKCSTAPIPPSRWQTENYYHPDANKRGHYNVSGLSMLERDIAAFDAPFFSLSEAETRAMDPQERLMLESAYLALENAGVPISNIAGRSDVGVFSAGSKSDYDVRIAQDLATMPRYTATGNTMTMFANKINYFFDLKGPSVTVDTACASSLTALDMAVQNVRSGRCKIAIVGGSFLQSSPISVCEMGAIGTLGKDGKSYSFDSRANGYGRGEGVACVIISTTDEAASANYPIRVAIKATGVNHCGRSQGITMPNGAAQAELIAGVYAAAGLDPVDTPYVEAHGTGTQRGDSIEAQSVSEAFRVSSRTADRPLYVGSVKSNFGHSEAASGVVSVIKCITMLENRMILPNANFEELNPALEALKSQFVIPRQPIPWPVDAPLRVSINNFGFGGSNAHVILEKEYQNPAVETNSTRTNGDISAVYHLDRVPTAVQEVIKSPGQVQFFPFSGKDEAAAKSQASAFLEYLETRPWKNDAHETRWLADLSYTLRHHRNHFDHQFAIPASSAQELIENLAYSPVIGRRAGTNKSVFVMTGQGSQWAGMAVKAMPLRVFAEAMSKADQCLRDLGCEWSLLDEICKPAESSSVDAAKISQPAVTAIQIGLVHLLRDWGIEPSAVVGHSSGEIAAAFAAGALTFESALSVAYFRGKVVSTNPKSRQLPEGAMLAVGASAEEVSPLVGDLKEGAANIACYNSAKSVTVAGDKSAIVELNDSLNAQGVFNRILKTERAYHSEHMTAFAPSYLEALQPRLCHFKESRDVRPVRFFSSVTGAEIPLGELTKPEYWVANMTSPVKFDAAMRSLLSEMGPTGKDLRAVIELGPHKALVNAVKDLISEKSPSSTWIYDPTLTRGNDGCSDLMDLAANLMAKGYHLDVAKIEAGSTGQKPATCLTDLPSYPFNLSRRYWHESRFADGPEKDSSPWQCLLGHKLPAVPGVELQCRNVFTLDDIPWLRDHVVNSQIVFPLAGYVCAVVEALQLLGDTAKSAHGFKLRNLVVGKAFVLSENQEHELFTTLKRATDSSESTSLTGTFDFQVSSWTSTGKFVEHCAGQASLDFESTGDDSLEIAHDRAGLAHELSRVREVACRDFGPQQLYEGTNRCGLAYGPHFRRVTSFKTCGDSAFGEVTVGDTSSCLPGEYEGHMTIHPTVLDAALHVGLTHLGDNRGDPTSMRAHVPVYFEELYVSSAISHQPGQVFEVYAYGPSADRRQRSTTGNMAMCEPGNDELLVNIRNMRLVDVHEDNDQARSEDMINPHKISWITHPLLNPLTERETKASPAEVAEYELLTQLSHFFVREALSRNDARPLSKPYMRNLISWMERIVSTGVDEKTVSFLATAREMPFAERERWFNQLVKDSVSAEFIIKAGRALPDVLYNDREPLEALLEDDCLYRLYDNSALFKTSRTCMSNLVDSLAYLNPSMKILEVGAGTGGFTSGVLEALTSETGSSRFEHYEYTDVSAGFFPKVKEKLQPWSSKMGFKKLDLAADVAQQGFEPEQYDLVIGALVVHATPDIEQSLKNIRRLLKPGGMIALVELCDNQQTNAGFLPFGMLPDWWLNGETGPWLTRKAWQDVVRRAGFAEIGDFWQDETANCVFWAHRDPPIASPLAPVAVVVDREPATLAETVQTHLSETLKSPVQLLTPAEAVDFDGNLICLEHPDGLSLYQWEQAQFDQAKAVILSSKNVLWVTTNEERQHRNALSAFALGVGRQIRNENASINFAVLQLDTASDGACAQVIGVVCEDTFVRCADLPNPEVEFRQRSGRIEIPRVLPARAVYANLAGRLNSGDAHSVPIDQEGTCLRATCRQPGLLNTLYFESSPACDISGEPDEDEVFIDVHATGLNFKDVVIALGRVPWEELGKECSGVVRTVGKRAAERYSPGDRVVHWGEGLFAAHARCHTSRLAKIPDGLSMEEAASLPLVFATAYECLVRVARLQKGEKVLIHAASGGVGQAAVMLAQQLGAEVFITVSTDEKKHLVCSTYGVPESHVYSSRKPESIERLARATGGVDVVLSSLSGDMVKASWKCLGIQGRFVDIGKRDALSNANLEMSPFARGASYVAVDLSLLIEHKPQYAQQLLEEVLDQAGRGVVRTVKPIMLKPIDQLEEALRFMQAGKHTGKIVIQIKKAAEVMVKQSPSMTKEFNSDATYVITGGTGGLGRAMVTWLAEHGAKNIAVLSRSGEAAMRSARWAVAAERVQSFGARIFPCKCDVGDIDSLRTALRGLDEQGAPPVKGVIHGAMVLRDALYESATANDWKAVVAPKVQGAFNLHEVLHGQPLDFFICLSSATIIGVALGQASYVGSNCVLDAFCEWRAGQGFPSASISLPSILDAGHVAEVMLPAGQQVWTQGAISTREVQILLQLAMDPSLVNPTANASHLIAGIQHTHEFLELVRDKSRLLSVASRNLENTFETGSEAVTQRSAKVSVKSQLLSADGAEDAKSIITEAVVGKIGEIMSLPVGDVSPERAVADFGVDSLVAVEFRSWMSKELDVTLPVLEIIGSPSVYGLVSTICTKSSLVK